jgi:hypothetical protein
VTLYAPNLILHNRAVFLSSIITDGLVDTAVKAARINAAIADAAVREVYFDIPLELTFARTASIDGATTSVFRIPSNRRLIGSPGDLIDASAWSTSATTGQRRYLFRADGTESAAVSLTADLQRARSKITVGSTGLAELVSYGLGPGAMVRITSDRLWIAGGTVGTEEQGELLTVASLTSDGFVFHGASHDDYDVADDARVHVVTPAAGIILEGIAALGPGMLSNGSTPIEGDRMLHMVLCSGLRLDDVSCTNFDSGNYFYSCPDGLATGFKWRCQTAGAAERAVNQYGFALVNACQDFVVNDATMRGGKHALVQTESGTARGVTRRCEFKNSTIFDTWNWAVAAHTNAEHIAAEGNFIEGCSGGVEGGCRGFVSRRNTVRFLQYFSPPPGEPGELGIGIGCTEVPEDFLSEGDRVYGGGYGFRIDTGAFAPLSGSNGPRKIRVRNFYAEASNQCGLEIDWTGAGDRDGVELTDISTRNIGQPVTAEGYPTTGTSTAAPSIRITGNGSGDLTRVSINGARLEGWAGNAAACILTADAVGVHIHNVSYADHAAPILGGSGVVDAAINAF